MANPKLLEDKGKLLKLARAKVNDDGYIYKKGKSRSKEFGNSEDSSTSSGKQVKRAVTTEYVRTQRILHLEDSLKDINKQINLGENRLITPININFVMPSHKKSVHLNNNGLSNRWN